jgi:hypothetical protein
MRYVVTNSSDSEVTRALKTYYIKQARDRSDLPDWLFNERERMVDKPTQRGESSDESSQNALAYEQSSRTRGRGLRDIYDTAAASAPAVRAREDERPMMYGSDASVGAPSRATNRLKALRDAKRQAVTAGRVSESDGRGSVHENASNRFSSRSGAGADGYDGQFDKTPSSRRSGREIRGPEQRMPPPRVGLPTHPRGR